MTDMGIRQGGPEWAQPVIIGKDTVYIHTNIRELEEGLYQYHERQYSLAEWDLVKDLYAEAEQVKAKLEEATTAFYNTSERYRMQEGELTHTNM